jgi:amidase
MQDDLGAFCRHSDVRLEGAAAGPLAGLTLAVKDIYDVAGETCCCGNPTWLASHEPAERTAPAVEALVDAGATVVGKTLTDELAYSLQGENAHYGTPENPAAPGRIPGGSSNGSASATAGGLVDLGLGSDTGGSVRIPASFCGLYGIRTSHGRLPLDGIMPLAPSFDTVGWFARDAALFASAGRAYFGDAPPSAPGRLLLAEDCFEPLDPPVRAAFEPALEHVAAALGPPEPVTVNPGDYAPWLMAFRILQAREIWTCHGPWVTEAKPEFGPGIRDRFAWAATLSDDDAAVQQPVRDAVTARMAELLADGAILCLPTAPGIAPLKETPVDEIEGFRNAILKLTCIAGHARLPQVNLPLARLDGCPVGLSLIAAPGGDEMLLAAAEQIAGLG